MKALGNVRNSDSNRAGSGATAASGGRMTFTKAAGLGKEMVANLDRVVSTYKRVKAAEHREDARAEAAARRAEREANAYADLDTLLDEVRG